MLTKTSALELAPRGVRVNAIAPAVIATHFHAAAGMGEAGALKYYDDSARVHPIGRVGRPDDIAELVLFLADASKSGFITGSIMLADGGRLLTCQTAPGLSSAPVAAAAAAAPAEGGAAAAGAASTSSSSSGAR